MILIIKRKHKIAYQMWVAASLKVNGRQHGKTTSEDGIMSFLLLKFQNATIGP